MSGGRLGPVLMLLATGAAWGLTMPLIRIAVSTGHAPLGIVVWQQAIMAALLAALLWPLGLRLPAVRGRLGLFAVVAAFGAVVPGYFTFLTAVDLPAGVRSILIAIVPMFTLPMALAMGFERPDARRALGVALGAAAITLLALPGGEASAAFGVGVVLLALVAPLSYGIEATYLAWRGPAGLHPFPLLVGASVVGIALAWPLAVATGQTVDLVRVWGPAEWAMLAAGALNALAYSGYVWLIGRAGPVFASQIAYVVTASGVVWSMLLLGERYSGWVWLAFALLAAGLALVQPRRAAAEAS